MKPLRVRYQTLEFAHTDIHLRTLRDNQEYADVDGIALELGISSATWPLFGIVWASGTVLAHLNQFYGEDRYGPWIEPSRSYMDNPLLLAITYAIPTIGLIGAAAARFRERMFFLLLLALGLFLAVGAHPWDDPAPANAVIKAFLQSDLGLSMRSLPRAAPLVVLALSVFAGALIAAISARRPRLARPLTAGLVGLSVLALPPLWRGQLVDANLDRAEDIPSYWTEAARALDARDDGTRVL